MIIDMSTPLDANDASTTFLPALDVSDPNRPKISIKPRCKEYAARRREAQAKASLLEDVDQIPFIPNVLVQKRRKKSPSSKTKVKLDVDASMDSAESEEERKGSGDAGHEASKPVKHEVMWSPVVSRAESRSPLLSEENRIRKPPRVHPTRATKQANPHTKPYVCALCSGKPPQCNLCKVIALMDKFCDTINNFEQRYNARSRSNS
ncbi:hypothetical protein ONZ45_g12514 [Pleurotus djamor]|nr:hypothetical protein ONZ45_g12514 [Pleurotus djamor]